MLVITAVVLIRIIILGILACIFGKSIVSAICTLLTVVSSWLCANDLAEFMGRGQK